MSDFVGISLPPKTIFLEKLSTKLYFLEGRMSLFINGFKDSKNVKEFKDLGELNNF